MARADDIRKRLTLARYPRRAAATFTVENDHNPLVLEDCGACRGTGTQCRQETGGGADAYALGGCVACGGAGVTGQVEPYFSGELPETIAHADPDRWVTCPCCDVRFKTSDPAAWTGRRHLRCGQKIGIR